MPRSLDPSSRLTFVLACDADKPAATQPRFFAKCLTLNQQRKLLTAVDGLRTSDTPESKLDSALDAAVICLTGWENMGGIEFSREAIGDVLSIDEIIEVFDAVIGASTPKVDDKKKSE